MNPEQRNPYSALLHAEFFNESQTTCHCDEYDVVEVSFVPGGTINEEAVVLEIDNLARCNDSAELAAMNIESIHISDRNMDLPVTSRNAPALLGRPQLIRKSVSLRFVGTKSSFTSRNSASPLERPQLSKSASLRFTDTNLRPQFDSLLVTSSDNEALVAWLHELWYAKMAVVFIEVHDLYTRNQCGLFLHVSTCAYS